MQDITIQYASDLHLEYYLDKEYEFNKFIRPVSEILVLLGDIGYPGQATYELFLRDCSQNFKLVILLAGNHEYYSSDYTISMGNINDKIVNICSTFDNVIFLNNNSFTYKVEDKEIIFFGTTLWSRITDQERYYVKNVSNDIKNIYENNHPITIDKINEMHKCNVNWLVSELEKHNDNDIIKIVLSHHLPSFKAIAPIYHGNQYNSLYASNLDYIINSYNINVWLFGHTHSRIDIKINNTILKCNPRGYENYENKFENDKYNEEEIIKV